MKLERETPRHKIAILEGDDGEHTFPAVTITEAIRLLNLMSKLSNGQARKLLEDEGLFDTAVSRVPATPTRKGIHQLIPVSALIQRIPDLSNILNDALTEYRESIDKL